jgi:hypothetical protein
MVEVANPNIVHAQVERIVLVAITAVAAIVEAAPVLVQAAIANQQQAPKVATNHGALAVPTTVPLVAALPKEATVNVALEDSRKDIRS